MRSRGVIRSPSGDIGVASSRIQTFRYRERFNLSYEDFINEPYEDFLINSEIMSIEAELQERENKKAQRARRR